MYPKKISKLIYVNNPWWLSNEDQQIMGLTKDLWKRIWRTLAQRMLAILKWKMPRRCKIESLCLFMTIYFK